VIARYLAELATQLDAVGIRGARRRRILAEAEDHLCESGDPDRFGDPALIAARFADELATAGARRLGFGVVAALAPAGLLYAVLLGFVRPGPDIASARTLPLGLTAAVLMLLAPQVALAAGLLSAAQAWRLRADASAPAAAVALLHRRVVVALGAGLVSTVAIGAYAYEYGAGLPPWSRTFTFAAATTAVVPLGALTAALTRTARVRPTTAGPAGDVFDDLAPLLDRLPFELRGRPWRFCLLFAVAVAALALVGGGVDEGPRNAIAEFAAVCVGFAVFGGVLGLRDSEGLAK
jgi:hypothetical protein